MNAQLDIDWSADNQQFLAAEFARMRALLGEGDLDQARTRIAEVGERMQAASSIDTLMTLFELSEFERDLLLLVAAVEMDSRIADLCAAASGHPQRPWVSFGLAMAVLPDPHWSALAPAEALRRWRLLDLDDSSGFTTGRLKLDERVLHFIGGLNYLDHRLRAQFRPLPPIVGIMAETHRQTATQISTMLQRSNGRLPVILLEGNDREGQVDVALTVAQMQGASLYQLQATDIPATAREQEALIELWQREAALLGSGLLIIHDGETDVHISKFIEHVNGLVFVAGPGGIACAADSSRFDVEKPDAPGQRKLWMDALEGVSDLPAEDLAGLACQYKLGARRIAGYVARLSGDNAKRDLSELHQLCRGDGKAMRELAQSVETSAQWDDLILPQSQLRLLRQLAVHARHRITVHHDWGFADKSRRGLGIATLFSGESGTGKTLAAEVLANVLELALYRIDLSAVVSKYIGETEKNLRKLFDAAEDTGAILLFDEADALFGKRSEVKDSHDRYANIEVSYLLQRMEAYRGLAILTTNHKTALDTAFQRRLRFVVNFPFPDAGQREAIWRAMFPPATPIEKLDYTRLARLNVTGGNIRNIAISAAFLAAEAKQPVSMSLILRAAQSEVAKYERSLSDAEVRGWV